MRIKIISNHTKYKKNQIVDLTEKEVMPLLTNGKAIRARREKEESPKTKKEKDKKPKDV